MNTFLQIQGGGGLVHQLRKSYSLTDLGNDESDFGGAELRAITNDTGKISIFFSRVRFLRIRSCHSYFAFADEIRELERLRRTGSAGRSNTSAQVRYVRHISSDEAQQAQMRRRTASHSRDSP